METVYSGDIDKDTRTHRIVIDEKRLPVYEEAAKKTGYGVEMTARAGEEILIDHRKDPGGRCYKVEVPPGNVQVAITIPRGQKEPGTEPFYKVVKELSKLVQSPK